MSNEYPPPPPQDPGQPPWGQPSSGQPQWGQQPQDPSQWGQQPPPPPGYGYEQAYGGQQPKRSTLAVIALVMGILGVLPCCWGCGVFSIAALVTGHLGKKEVAESQGRVTGGNLAQWGFTLGIVGLALSVVYWILVATGVIDINAYSNLD